MRSSFLNSLPGVHKDGGLAEASGCRQGQQQIVPLSARPEVSLKGASKSLLKRRTRMQYRDRMDLHEERMRASLLNLLHDQSRKAPTARICREMLGILVDPRKCTTACLLSRYVLLQLRMALERLNNVRVLIGLTLERAFMKVLCFTLGPSCSSSRFSLSSCLHRQSPILPGNLHLLLRPAAPERC